MADTEVGTVLGGKFVVEGVLGRGGMGVVYAARHRELDQRVAIKCLLPHALSMPDVVERFAREARAAAKIHGEHVARVIDVGRFEDGTPYIVMEYLQGHDLSYELAARGTIGVTDAIRYLLETCEALAQAHATRIVHRDLKPSNLFLAETPGRRPIVKVLDFGISKVVDAGGNALTNTSSVMGTPYYMSPEQLLSSKNVDERSDIWALGVILYELLAGQPPFSGETAPEIIAKIVHNMPAPPRSVRADVPEGLEAVILRCMRTRADERYANVAQLAAALQPFAADSDRESVAAIARVLGVSEAALSPHSLEGAPTESTPAARVHRDADGSTAATQLPSPHAAAPAHTPATVQSARPAPLGTAPSLSISSRDVPAPGRRPGWVVPLVVGLALAAGAGSVVMLRGRTPPPAAATIAPPAIPSAPEPSVAPVATLPPLDAVPSASAPASSVASAAVSRPVVPAAPARPAPSGPSRPGAPSAAPSAAPAPPPPPAPTSHNPLDLQIK